jgi:hypothetical protein
MRTWYGRHTVWSRSSISVAVGLLPRRVQPLAAERGRRTTVVSSRPG